MSNSDFENVTLEEARQGYWEGMPLEQRKTMMAMRPERREKWWYDTHDSGRFPGTGVKYAD